MAKLYRLGAVIHCLFLAVALGVASLACHDDRILGEVVGAGPPGLCGGAPCSGWCERPQGRCDGPAGQGICRPPVTTTEERNALLSSCAPLTPDTVTMSRVCGCNGVTFGNDCQRRVSQVSLFGSGACPYGPACASNMDCAVGEFCEFPDLRCGGVMGTCRPGGPAAARLLCDADSGAVCGCDGKTYGSECERHRAGVSKRSDGRCQAP